MGLKTYDFHIEKDYDVIYVPHRLYLKHPDIIIYTKDQSRIHEWLLYFNGRLRGGVINFARCGVESNVDAEDGFSYWSYWDSFCIQQHIAVIA